MYMRWLTPAIDARTTELFDNFFESELTDLLKLVHSLPDGFELENSYILSLRKAIEVAYAQGIRDASSLLK